MWLHAYWHRPMRLPDVPGALVPATQYAPPVEEVAAAAAVVVLGAVVVASLEVVVGDAGVDVAMGAVTASTALLYAVPKDGLAWQVVTFRPLVRDTRPSAPRASGEEEEEVSGSMPT